VIQGELSSEVATMLAAHMFGEAALPMPAGIPAGCPRDELPE